ncbi:MAG: MFS transporter [Hyphomicrobiales bacterium]
MRNKKPLIITACISGTILEWYDFTLFGIFSPVISELFFPSDSKVVSLLATFGTFALGFIARPIGAFILGNRGDQKGRKSTFLFSLILMIIPSILIGLLPTYHQIGVWSPALLILLRIIQGISLGGESGGAITYLAEYAKPRERGMFAALPLASAHAGILLSSVIGFVLIEIIGKEDLHSWGWRIPFILTLVLGLIAFYLRKKMEETEVFQELKKKKKVERLPVKTIFHKQGKTLLLLTGAFLTSVSFPYFLFFYLPSFITRNADVSERHSFLINTLILIVTLIIIPLFAYLVPSTQRKKSLIILNIIIAVLVFPVFHFFLEASLHSYLLLVLCLGVFSSGYLANMPAFVSENFYHQFRYTGTNVSMNVASAIFGGTVPLIMTWLSTYRDFKIYAALYFFILAVLSLISVLLIRYKNQFVDK